MEGSVDDEDEGKSRPLVVGPAKICSSAAKILGFPDAIDPRFYRGGQDEENKRESH
jgi:hypothetical protein